MNCANGRLGRNCILRPFNSEVRERYPHLLSLAKDAKLGKYTVPTGKRTPGRRVAVHYATAAPRKLPLMYYYTMTSCNYGLSQL